MVTICCIHNLFFPSGDVQIAPNGVHFTFSREGRPSGEAFVQLLNEEAVEVALTKHKAHMGQRYIEGKCSNKCNILFILIHFSGVEFLHKKTPQKVYFQIKIVITACEHITASNHLWD